MSEFPKLDDGAKSGKPKMLGPVFGHWSSNPASIFADLMQVPKDGYLAAMEAHLDEKVALDIETMGVDPASPGGDKLAMSAMVKEPGGKWELKTLALPVKAGKTMFSMLYGQHPPCEQLSDALKKFNGGISKALLGLKPMAMHLDELSLVGDFGPFVPREPKPWEAKLPHERPAQLHGFRTERRAASAKNRRRAKMARRQRRRCR